MSPAAQNAVTTELADLLSRVRPVLAADQQRPIDEDLTSAITRALPADLGCAELPVAERIALGNYYYCVNEPLKALDCYWSAAEDATADGASATLARNNASVVYLMFCPGYVAEQILGSMFGPQE